MSKLNLDAMDEVERRLAHGAADEEKPAIARWDCMHSMSCLE